MPGALFTYQRSLSAFHVLFHAQPVCDNHLLDFRGSLIDLGDLRIAHHSLDGIISCVAVAAIELQAAAGNIAGVLCSHKLCHSGKMAVVLSIVLRAGCLINQKLCSLGVGRHLRQLKLGVLELGNALAELYTAVDVFHGLLDGALRDTKGLSCDTDTSAVQGHHGYLEALVQLAQHVLLRNLHILKNQLCRCGSADSHLLLVLADGEAFHILLNDEGGDSMIALLLVGHGKYDINLCRAGVGV